MKKRNKKNPSAVEKRQTDEKALDTNELVSNIKSLRRRMMLTNVLFHSVRNNPRHREKYYFALIAIVEDGRWKVMNERIRMNWESARPSFDRMYGMVKDFSWHAEYYAKLFSEEKSDKAQSSDNKTDDKIDKEKPDRPDDLSTTTE